MADVTINSKKIYASKGVLESDLGQSHPLVSWRSVVAGFLVTFLSMAILLSLGMAFGGVTLSDESTPGGAGIFTGVWFLISSIISLFVGSYFAARISKFHTNRIGSAQGLVIASLFFAFFIAQVFSVLGWAGRTAGTAVGGAASFIGTGASQAADNPVVRNTIENALGDLNLKSEPRTVASGIATRLLRGDREGTKVYLAQQAGISPEEADRRIEGLRTQIDSGVAQVREATAKGLQAAGWSLFVMLLLGSAAAIGGGALGSRANLRKPLTREQVDVIAALRPATI